MEKTTLSASSATFLKDIYARMLLTRIVDDCAWSLFEQGRFDFVASSRGHEAAQVGSAVCIEVGVDFTLPYYRDLGVVLTIGMTPYEVFRTYLQAHHRHAVEDTSKETVGRGSTEARIVHHWGYQKHNMITGAAPVATQILHAAGIAFACKLRKAQAVTVAYCGDGATVEPDFLEGIRFAAQHSLPALFICEQDCSDTAISSLQELELPPRIEHRCIDGGNVLEVHNAMREAMWHARSGLGPILLEMHIVRSKPGRHEKLSEETIPGDPLLRCQKYLEEQKVWDEEWATELYERTLREVERARGDALRDVLGVG
ncbi:MAG TPA: thiamine pyrophosphate-dependent enzyme [Ktedonobacteraceae bacterium]|nr:thiamine pyrophosphate-dependent enzyme [Ktedonobacteraceae bacterium]